MSSPRVSLPQLCFQAPPLSQEHFHLKAIYYLQSQNLLHTAPMVISYNGAYYTNVEPLDTAPQNLRLGHEKCRFYFATHIFWFSDTEYFYTVKFC